MRTALLLLLPLIAGACARGGSQPAQLAPGVSLSGTYQGTRTLTSLVGPCTGLGPVGLVIPFNFVVAHNPSTGAITLDPGTDLEVSGVLNGTVATMTGVFADITSTVVITFAPDGRTFTTMRSETEVFPPCQLTLSGEAARIVPSQSIRVEAKVPGIALEVDLPAAPQPQGQRLWSR